MRTLNINAEAAIRIQEARRVALEANTLIHQLTRTLHQSARASAASNRRFKQTMLQRRELEETLKTKGNHDTKLLADTQRRLKGLQQLTRKCLSAQEDNRKSVSLLLHDEIAQGLLGVHVRLLALKRAMKISEERLQSEIGGAQRLVRKSTQQAHRFARDRGKDGKA